ncbi:MAG: outer membrane protein assembly factor BamB [Betaproteobacteria bacterium]|nr:outer membrane protein assembly factor BamB [Betaproteobacteria bacterium]
MRSDNRAGLVPALAACALLLGSCSTLDKFNPFSRPSGPKPAELPQISGERAVRVLWSASVGSADRYVFSPAVAGEAVYAASRDGTVARFMAADGRQAWRTSLDTRLSAGAGAGGTTVAVANAEGEVIALDAKTGAERWRARVSSEVLASPAVAAGLVIVRSVDSRVFAFGEEDGKRRWVYQRAAASLMIRTPAGIATDVDTAYAGFSGGRLAAINLSNGAVRWEAVVANPRGATELERVTDVVGTPAVQGREVCAAAYQGRIACFEAESGRPVWAFEFSSLTGVSVDARYAYASDDRGAVQALDRSSGRAVWKQDRLRLRQLTQPQALGEAVAVGDFEGYVHFLARDSGAFVARYGTGSSAIRATPVPLAPAANAVLVQSQNGGLFALGL